MHREERGDTGLGEGGGGEILMHADRQKLTKRWFST